MPITFTWHERAEEPDATLVWVWMHPTEGPHALDDDGLPEGGPQCVRCGSFDPDTGEPADEPYRINPDRPTYVECVPCGALYPVGVARADETVF